MFISASCKRLALYVLSLIAFIEIPMGVSANTVQIGDLYYNLNLMDHTASVAPGAKAADLSENLIIPSSVEQDNEFYEVTSIEAAAFKGISKFSYLEIPSSVTLIGREAFSECLKLKKVKFADSEEPLRVNTSFLQATSTVQEVYLGRYIMSATSDYVFPFSDSDLVSLEISPIIKKIPARLFQGCKQIEVVRIPEGIEVLGAYCFASCSALKEVYLPSTLINVEEEAFSNCTLIDNVYVAAIVPPEIDQYGFYDALYNKNITHTLHVLPEAKAAYESHTVWKQFTVVGDMQGASKESVILTAEGNGTLAIGESEVHNATQEMEVSVNGGEVEVIAVPDYGYEFKSLTATLADGSAVYYAFRHEGGDIIANVPFTNGMKLSASFAQPELHTLTVSSGDGSKYNLKVAAGKAYSFDYTAPHGYVVNSVTFAEKPLEVSGLSTQSVNIQTPPLNSDGVLSIAIAAIVTDVSWPNVNAPSVIVNGETILLSGLRYGETVTVSTLSGLYQTYKAIGNTLTIPVIEEGVYVIVTSCGTLKVRI